MVAMVKPESPPRSDVRLARALEYAAQRRRQLDRAVYLLPGLLAILPDADVDTIGRLIDLIAGAPAELFEDVK